MTVLLDLFCGAGGASVGYARAGFTVVGVDIRPQPHYPFEFIQADALDIAELAGNRSTGWGDVAAIHASPPCQAFTKAQRIQKNRHPDLVEPVRALLKASGLPYVIENVPGAPLRQPFVLCGLMFGLSVDRDRLFETGGAGFSIAREDLPVHPAHDRPKAKMGRPPRPGEIVQVVGNFSGAKYAREAMGIPWMVRDELREAIPPAYTEFIGRRLMESLRPLPVLADIDDGLRRTANDVCYDPFPYSSNGGTAPCPQPLPTNASTPLNSPFGEPCPRAEAGTPPCSSK